MRFCNECGPVGWKEGHNAGCYILQDKNSTPPVTPEAFMAIDQVSCLHVGSCASLLLPISQISAKSE